VIVLATLRHKEAVEPEITDNLPAAAGQEALLQRQVRLATLVREHFSFVWRFLRRMGLSSHDADDAAQATFVVACSKLEAIVPGAERRFLYTVARKLVANARRAERTRRAAQRLEEVWARPPVPGPDQEAERERELALLDAVLRAMPLELRVTLILSEVEEMNATEIAATQGLPAGTVRSRLRRARAVFRQLLRRAAQGNLPMGGTR
jgi:RNA polymerase sigma-70 factor (ECF subfamily)